MNDEYRRPSEREFKVGVFEHPGKRKVRLMAYTRTYNPDWDGCCEHAVLAGCGDVAKLKAMREHQALCMKGHPCPPA